MHVEQSKHRWLGRTARLAAWALGLLLVLYVVALCDEHYEARRGMRIYDQVLAVRLGDTVEEFSRKAPGCKIGNADGEYACVVEPVVQRIEHPLDWYMMHRYEEFNVWQNVHRQKIGLRDWYFWLSVTVRQGRISEMYTQFFVVGRDMMLGGGWSLEPEIRPASVDGASAARSNIRTAIHPTRITGSWSGSGYSMHFTSSSDEQHLRMREVNSRCLTSFTGCRDSRELWPNLPSSERWYW